MAGTHCAPPVAPRSKPPVRSRRAAEARILVLGGAWVTLGGGRALVYGALSAVLGAEPSVRRDAPHAGATAAPFDRGVVEPDFVRVQSGPAQEFQQIGHVVGDA